MEASRARMGTSSFTHNGDYFALLSVDGRLRIWDTLSGKVVQEFSSNSAAQSSCTCLCWTRRNFNRGDKKKLKRRRKKNEKQDIESGASFPSLAIGTDKGYIFCYNPTTGEIEKLNKDGHIDRINCVAYHEKEDTLYTCSDDRYIIQWCANNHLIKSKWKADKRGVKKICLGPSGKTLLSAGCSIKLWNLETNELLQEFHGHSSPVSLLQFSPYKQNLIDGTDDDGYYFLSASLEDRVVNAWQVNSKKQEMMAIASFLISDVAIFMDTILDEEDNQPLKLCVGCRDGRIHFFTCTMNGRAAKPIESSKTVDYLMKEGTSTHPVPFIDGILRKKEEVNLHFVHGHTLNLSFVNLCYSKLDATSKIEKDVKNNLLLSELKPEAEKAIQLADYNCSPNFISDTTATTMLPAKVRKTMIPAYSANLVVPDGDGKVVADGDVKVVADGDLQKEELLSMGERMETAPGFKKFKMKMKAKRGAPNAGSFAQMLMQALHSNDSKLIRELMFNNNIPPKILMETIKRVPNDLVELLVRNIADLLLWNPKRSRYLVVWIKSIMAVHLTYLLTSEMSREAFGSLYTLVKSQEEIHMPLLNLQGKIDMLFSYVAGNEITTEEYDDDIFSIPAAIYDDSSDETEEVWGKVRKEKQEVNQIMDFDATTDDNDDTTEMEGTDNDTSKIDGSGNNDESEIDTESDVEVSEHSEHESEDEG